MTSFETKRLSEECFEAYLAILCGGRLRHLSCYLNRLVSTFVGKLGRSLHEPDVKVRFIISLGLKSLRPGLRDIRLKQSRLGTERFWSSLNHYFECNEKQHNWRYWLPEHSRRTRHASI